MRPRLGCESNLEPDTAGLIDKQKRFGKHGWPYIGVCPYVGWPYSGGWLVLTRRPGAGPLNVANIDCWGWVYGRPKHLQRHLCEYDFRYTHRIKLGVDDQMPRDLALDQGQAMDASLA
jgi:hypothetical protein